MVTYCPSGPLGTLVIRNRSDRLDEKGCIPERKTDQSQVFRSEKRTPVARLRQKVMRPCPALVHFVCLTDLRRSNGDFVLRASYLKGIETTKLFCIYFRLDIRLTFRVTDSRSLLVARDEAEGRRGGQRLARGIITKHNTHITAHAVLIMDNWSTNDTSSPYHNLRGIREPRYY